MWSRQPASGRRGLRPGDVRRPPQARDTDGCPPARSVVDYALARRATLADLFAGRVTTTDVCDAHPYLLRAAKFHGESTERDCPVCRRERLTQVIYTYGDCFRAETNGRVRASIELARLAREYPEFTVYVVEVCRGCGWNHLTSSYVLGTGSNPGRLTGSVGKKTVPADRRRAPGGPS